MMDNNDNHFIPVPVVFCTTGVTEIGQHRILKKFGYFIKKQMGAELTNSCLINTYFFSGCIYFVDGFINLGNAVSGHKGKTQQ